MRMALGAGLGTYGGGVSPGRDAGAAVSPSTITGSIRWSISRRSSVAASSASCTPLNSIVAPGERGAAPSGDDAVGQRPDQRLQAAARLGTDGAQQRQPRVQVE